jgi:hypothetical protein
VGTVRCGLKPQGWAIIKNPVKTGCAAKIFIPMNNPPEIRPPNTGTKNRKFGFPSDGYKARADSLLSPSAFRLPSKKDGIRSNNPVKQEII